MSADALTIELNGHPLMLSAKRAAFDPVRGCLLVADAHLGKGRGVSRARHSGAGRLDRRNAGAARSLDRELSAGIDRVLGICCTRANRMRTIRWHRYGMAACASGLRLVLVEATTIDMRARWPRNSAWRRWPSPIGSVHGRCAITRGKSTAPTRWPATSISSTGAKRAGRPPAAAVFSLRARARACCRRSAHSRAGMMWGRPRADERRYVIGGDRVSASEPDGRRGARLGGTAGEDATKNPRSQGPTRVSCLMPVMLRVFGGGDGGNRTRVQKRSTTSSTCLVLSFDLTATSRTNTLRDRRSARFSTLSSRRRQGLTDVNDLWRYCYRSCDTSPSVN